MLSFCHRIISDPNQIPSDISSDVLLKIILSPGDYHRTWGREVGHKKYYIGGVGLRQSNAPQSDVQTYCFKNIILFELIYIPNEHHLIFIFL